MSIDAPSSACSDYMCEYALYSSQPLTLFLQHLSDKSHVNVQIIHGNVNITDIAL
jgi:hypothetical protein